MKLTRERKKRQETIGRGREQERVNERRSNCIHYTIHVISKLITLYNMHSLLCIICTHKKWLVIHKPIYHGHSLLGPSDSVAGSASRGAQRFPSWFLLRARTSVTGISGKEEQSRNLYHVATSWRRSQASHSGPWNMCVSTDGARVWYSSQVSEEPEQARSLGGGSSKPESKRKVLKERCVVRACVSLSRL